MKFCMECRHFLEAMTAKIAECCPLKHELVPVISCICPQITMRSQVYDSMRNAGGALAVEITKSMIECFRGARSRILVMLMPWRRRKQKLLVRTEQRHAESELKQLLANRAKLKDSVAVAKAALDSKIAELRKTAQASQVS